MVKRIVFAVLQFIAFFGLLYAGGYWDVISLGLAFKAMMPHPSTMDQLLASIGQFPLIKFPMGSHILIADGIVFASILLAIILLIQALRKKLVPAAYYTLGAYALAIVLSLMMKIGLPPAN